MIKTTIYICGNTELLANDVDNETDAEIAVNEFINAATNVIERSNLNVDYKVDASYHNWQGGSHYQTGVKVGEDVYGYRCGFISTLIKNPSDDLKRLINEASDAAENARTDWVNYVNERNDQCV